MQVSYIDMEFTTYIHFAASFYDQGGGSISQDLTGATDSGVLR